MGLEKPSWFMPNEPNKIIFISHKETDQEIAEALVEYLLAALDVQENQILCTSVSGHEGLFSVVELLINSYGGIYKVRLPLLLC